MGAWLQLSTASLITLTFLDQNSAQHTRWAVLQYYFRWAQGLFPPVHGPSAQLWACPAISIRPCCKMGLTHLPQRGWGLAQPPPCVDMAPTEWLRRRCRGGRAFMPSVYRGQYSTVVICWISSKLPRVIPLRPSTLLQARTASQETLLQEPHAGPEGISPPLTQWWWEVTSPPHNPACLLPHVPTLWLLTTFTRWPGVAEMSQVHSFRLGYLSGQLGLLIIPSAPLSLCSQPAWERETALGQVSHGNPAVSYMVLCAHWDPLQGRHGRLQTPNKTFYYYATVLVGLSYTFLS